MPEKRVFPTEFGGCHYVLLDNIRGLFSAPWILSSHFRGVVSQCSRNFCLNFNKPNWGRQQDLALWSALLNNISLWERVLITAHTTGVTQSNIRGHCCASMALLIKQTFHPHNSNVWTERVRRGAGWGFPLLIGWLLLISEKELDKEN